jgi:hypothetical protein
MAHVRTDVSDERIASNIRVEIISEIETTLAVSNKWKTLRDSNSDASTELPVASRYTDWATAAITFHLVVKLKPHFSERFTSRRKIFPTVIHAPSKAFLWFLHRAPVLEPQHVASKPHTINFRRREPQRIICPPFLLNCTDW